MSAAPAVGVLAELAVVDLCVVFERLDASRVTSVVDPTGDGALIEAVCRVRDRDRVLQSVGKAARAARAGLHRYQTGNDAGAAQALVEISGPGFASRK